ncbi:MAG: hypothetical protein KF816_17140 [Melioribacteraceae bacterium]|nr:hypothetical protein [Melioribacteraceae bacterium]
MESSVKQAALTDNVVEAIKLVRIVEPALTNAGFEPKADYSKNPLVPDEVQATIDWINANTVRTKTYNPRMDSYSLKHKVEVYSRKIGNGMYIGNGAAIAAFIILGIPYKQILKTKNAIPQLKLKPQKKVKILPYSQWKWPK